MAVTILMAPTQHSSSYTINLQNIHQTLQILQPHYMTLKQFYLSPILFLSLYVSNFTSFSWSPCELEPPSKRLPHKNLYAFFLLNPGHELRMPSNLNFITLILLGIL
jgi:hypothetical protein